MSNEYKDWQREEMLEMEGKSIEFPLTNDFCINCTGYVKGLDDWYCNKFNGLIPCDAMLRCGKFKLREY